MQQRKRIFTISNNNNKNNTDLAATSLNIDIISEEVTRSSSERVLLLCGFGVVVKKPVPQFLGACHSLTR